MKKIVVAVVLSVAVGLFGQETNAQAAGAEAAASGTNAAPVAAESSSAAVVPSETTNAVTAVAVGTTNAVAGSADSTNAVAATANSPGEPLLPEGVVKVLEQDSEKPVPFASAYLTAKNDTLITNFALTDTTGLARITKVTRGNYVLTIEMLGYKTYNKEHYFSFDWDRDSVNLGVIHLAEDAQMLDAAHVSAIGNPIEIKQDTIIFNAASFQMGQNQMLEDLEWK